MVNRRAPRRRLVDQDDAGRAIFIRQKPAFEADRGQRSDLPDVQLMGEFLDRHGDR